MAWEVKLFETRRGESPVEKFIEEQDPPTIAKIAHEIDLLERHGPFLGMPHSRKITADLYELRVRGVVEVRILYAFYKKTVVLLHAFKKKRPRIPAKEIRTAKGRLNQLDKI